MIGADLLKRLNRSRNICGIIVESRDQGPHIIAHGYKLFDHS